MDHIAFLKKSWKLDELILKGIKTIESRWYMSKHSPWNKISKGDVIYFKSSSPVNLKAKVSDVLQFDNLTPFKVRELADKYSSSIGLSADKIFDLNKDKKYCILVFLSFPCSIPPFDIDKKGFGNQCAWITVNSIDMIKIG